MSSKEQDKTHIGLTTKQLESADHSDVSPEIVAEGQQFIEAEKELSQRASLLIHWKGAFFSIALSFALVMEGYDVIMGAFFGQPQFQRYFGSLHEDGTYHVSADWQSTISNVQTTTNLIGLLITGLCQERYGSRKTYICGMILMTLTIFVAVFAQNIQMFLAAEALMALPWGMFQTLSTAYAAEICPINLRGLLGSFVNMAWGIGLVLSAVVARACLTIDSDWAWRLPFCIQWVWPLPLAIICYFAPESPWWLVRHGRMAEAKEALLATAIPGHYDGRNLDTYVAYMKHVDNIEKTESKSGSFADCFRGTNLRRTEIMLGLWLVQVWSGQGITGLTVQFLESAGMAPSAAFGVNIALTSMVIVGCIMAWFILPYVGRRTMYLSTLVTVGVLLLVIGVLAFTPISRATQGVTAALMVLIQLLYSMSVGPLCYAISGELPSARLRSKSIVLGRGIYVACGYIVGQIAPRFVSPTSWNIGAKSAFFWLAMNIVCTIWCYFRLPETGGFSFEELDILFANKISARKFKTVTFVENFASVNPTASKEMDEKRGTELDEHVESLPVAELR